jgi:hypothetical protein
MEVWVLCGLFADFSDYSCREAWNWSIEDGANGTATARAVHRPQGNGPDDL